MSQEEQVLVVERAVFEALGNFHGLQFDVDRYREKLFAGIPRFMPRSRAETDPNYKQLIPYVVMTCGGSILSYVRGVRAGENRLVGLRSIGIGGHINPEDDDNMLLFKDNYFDTYCTAVEREVAEEVSVETGHVDQIVALLNDETNEVGRVHLGIVHHWRLDEPKVTKREQMITQMAFMSPVELLQAKDSLETWSALCLDYFCKSQTPEHLKN